MARKKIGRTTKPQETLLISQLNAKSPSVEAYKLLRTNINFASADRPLQLIGVTSSGPGEGKSTVASNLAIAMAQSGQSVLLMDNDLRRSRVHKVFRMHKRPTGVTEILTGTSDIADCLQKTDIENLTILTAGAIPPNPSELLGSKKMQQLVQNLKEQFDIVIADLPPVISVTDALVMSPLVDGFIFVISSGSTDKRAALSAKDLLLNAKANIIGAVLNRAEPQKSYGSYYSHYYYYYTHNDD